jgi:hypothetical protein
MEVKSIQLPRKTKKEVVVVAQPQRQKKKKSTKLSKSEVKSFAQLNRKVRPNVSLRAVSNTLGDGFKNYIMAPDIFGPFRQPRAGGCVRTGLAYDQTLTTITGSSTNTVQAVQQATQYNISAFSFTAANTTTGFSSITNVSPGVQTPNISFVDDINMTAASIIVEYLGSPLNAVGELSIGNIAVDNDALASNATYNGLYFYPGMIHVPIASLIDKPLRVWLQKAGPAADQFINPVNTGLPDVNVCFVATSGQLASSTLNVIITRSFEFRSSTTSGDIYPYEQQSTSFSKEFDQFTDTRMSINTADPSSVGAALPGYVEQAMGIIGNSPATSVLASAGASALIGAIGRRHVGRLRARGPGGLNGIV